MKIPSFVHISVFAIFGPPLGALVFWSLTNLPTMLEATYERGVDAWAWSASLKLLSTYATYSYFLGFFPAIGSGVAYALACRKLWSVRARIFCASSTGLVLTALLLVFGAKESARDGLTVSLIAAGGVASLLIGTLFEAFAVFPNVLRRGNKIAKYASNGPPNV